MKTTEAATHNVSLVDAYRQYLGLEPAKPTKFYHEVMSAALTESLIRHYLVEGKSSYNIAVLCSDTFEQRTGHYCGGDIHARVFTEQRDYITGIYDIVISTRDKASEHPGYHKILHNTDNKKIPYGFDEVYNYYTHKSKKKLITNFKLNVPDRKWEQLFNAYPDYYRRNYIYLTTRHFFKYLQLHPEVWEEDVLWHPNFDFAGKNIIRDHVYNLVVYLNRSLAYKHQINDSETLYFYSNLDGRNFNPFITRQKELRNTVLHQSLMERFTAYTAVEVDFNNCFQNVILKGTGAITPETIIDFKQLTEAGKNLTPQKAISWCSKFTVEEASTVIYDLDTYTEKQLKFKGTSKDSIEGFLNSYENGGSAKLCKTVINSVFNGAGRCNERNPRLRIEKMLRWLVAYEWDSVDFDKLNNLEWLKSDAYFLCARAERVLRDSLKHQIDNHITGCRYIPTHDGMVVFVPKEEQDKLQQYLQKNKQIAIDESEICEDMGYSLTVHQRSTFPYKYSTELKYMQRNEFITEYGLIDNKPLSYNHKGEYKDKAKDKNKHHYGYVVPKSKRLDACVCTREYMEHVCKEDCVRRFASQCNAKKYQMEPHLHKFLSQMESNGINYLQRFQSLTDNHKE